MVPPAQPKSGELSGARWFYRDAGTGFSLHSRVIEAVEVARDAAKVFCRSSI